MTRCILSQLAAFLASSNLAEGRALSPCVRPGLEIDPGFCKFFSARKESCLESRFGTKRFTALYTAAHFSYPSARYLKVSRLQESDIQDNLGSQKCTLD